MSAAARLLRSWVRISPGAWMFVSCECYVLSGRGLCDELITRPEESYRLWCDVVCNLWTSRMRRSWPALGRSATEKKYQRLYKTSALLLDVVISKHDSMINPILENISLSLCLSELWQTIRGISEMVIENHSFTKTCQPKWDKAYLNFAHPCIIVQFK